IDAVRLLLANPTQDNFLISLCDRRCGHQLSACGPKSDTTLTNVCFWGVKRTWRIAVQMSAFGPKADMAQNRSLTHYHARCHRLGCDWRGSRNTMVGGRRPMMENMTIVCISWSGVVGGLNGLRVFPPFDLGDANLCASFYNKCIASPANQRQGNAFQQCKSIRRQGYIVVRTNERAGSRQLDRSNFPCTDFCRSKCDHRDNRRRRTYADARPDRHALERDADPGKSRPGDRR